MKIGSEQDMIKLAQSFAERLAIGDSICLRGDLGVGKSVFARGLVRAWLDDQYADVPSPSFSLVQEYERDNRKLAHVDLYRLDGEDGLFELGFPEAFDTQISVIEWPERLGGLLPPRRIEIMIEDKGDEERLLALGFIGEWSWKI